MLHCTSTLSTLRSEIQIAVDDAVRMKIVDSLEHLGRCLHKETLASRQKRLDNLLDGSRWFAMPNLMVAEPSKKVRCLCSSRFVVDLLSLQAL